MFILRLSGKSTCDFLKSIQTKLITLSMWMQSNKTIMHIRFAVTVLDRHFSCYGNKTGNLHTAIGGKIS